MNTLENTKTELIIKRGKINSMTEKIITSNESLKKLVNDGHFFPFCIAFSLNKGFEQSMRQKQEFEFSVGDYEVKFNSKKGCFTLRHKIDITKVITTRGKNVYYTNNNEQEVISELLTELEKELN